MARIFSILLNREVDVSDAELEKRLALAAEQKKERLRGIGASAEDVKTLIELLRTLIALLIEKAQPSPMVAEIERLENDKDGRMKRVLIIGKPVKLPPRGGGETLQ